MRQHLRFRAAAQPVGIDTGAVTNEVGEGRIVFEGAPGARLARPEAMGLRRSLDRDASANSPAAHRRDDHATDDHQCNGDDTENLGKRPLGMRAHFNNNDFGPRQPQWRHRENGHQDAHDRPTTERDGTCTGTDAGHREQAHDHHAWPHVKLSRRATNPRCDTHECPRSDPNGQTGDHGPQNAPHNPQTYIALQFRRAISAQTQEQLCSARLKRTPGGARGRQRPKRHDAA